MKYLFAVLFLGSISIFLTSCKEKEFRGELELVKMIIDNPEKLEAILESSSLFNPKYFDSSLKDRKPILVSYVKDKNVKVNKLSYEDYTYKGEVLKNVKIIDVGYSGAPFTIFFCFAYIDNAWRLININSLF